MKTIARGGFALGLLALVLGAGGASTAVAAAAGAEPTATETAKARDAIWAMEQAIYRGRAKGDISAYRDNLAKGYLAWPPMLKAPMRADGFSRPSEPIKAGKEQLAMTFVDFSMQGDTAIIYYRTHRTAKPDGTPTDEWFEVTHTWVRQGGIWRVFGGMARLAKAP